MRSTLASLSSCSSGAIAPRRTAAAAAAASSSSRASSSSLSHASIARRSALLSPNARRSRPSFRGSVTVATFNPGSGPVGLTPELKSALDDFVAKHRVIAFIKGTKDFPQCGFSNTVVQILSSAGVPFETVDVLADDRLRSSLKEYSAWPTFPQVYIAGSFFGGCDIMIEAYQSGELVEVLETALSE